jgi:imidazolonepropionase-like amidohydrolase
MAHEISRRGVLLAGLATGAMAATGGHPPAAAMATSTARGASRPLALAGVTVVDVAGSRLRPDTTVLVRGERIITVGRRDEVGIPHGAAVVELPGKYVIPGLWDMHTHSFGSDRISPALYVAAGVTSVREMAGTPLIHQWRDRIQSGRLLGPRWTIASTIIDGNPSLLTEPGEDPPGAIVVTNAAEARRAVRQAKRVEGADFVKVYSRLSPEAYAALADEARRQRIPFAGHCPDLVPITRAIHAGQRSIEHLHTLWLATSSRQVQVREALNKLTIIPGDYGSWFRQLHPIEWLAATNYDPGRAADIFARLRRQQIRIAPTLVMHHVLDKPEDAPVHDARLKYVPAETQQWWQWALEHLYKASRSPEEMAQQRELFERRLRFVNAMQRAGVPLLAGSDTGTPYSFPGFTLHDELALLVQAGLTPLKALRSATLEPARFLGVQDSLGTVDHGKLADLVVLDANPLADITNTKRIHSLLVRGQLITPEHRARILADVEAAAKEPPQPAEAGGGSTAAATIAATTYG